MGVSLWRVALARRRRGRWTFEAPCLVVLAQARCSLCGEAYTVVGAARAAGVVEDAVEGEVAYKRKMTYGVAGACGCA